jgi:hypothetical protein
MAAGGKREGAASPDEGRIDHVGIAGKLAT